jgi:hypothetical protein
MPVSKKANTARRRRMWHKVERSAKRRGLSAGRAVRAANAAVKRDVSRAKRKRSRTRRRRR